MTYCIKEVINGKIFWRLNDKSVGLWGSYGLKQGNPLQFSSKHLSNCICFVYFSILDLLYQRGYQRQYFWTLHLKVLAYEAATAWNRGIPCKILKLLIKLYLILLNGSKMLSEVRSFEIIWICRPIRQIQRETGESLVSSSKYFSNYICYVHFFILWLVVSKRLWMVRSFGD